MCGIGTAKLLTDDLDIKGTLQGKKRIVDSGCLGSWKTDCNPELGGPGSGPGNGQPKAGLDAHPSESEDEVTFQEDKAA